MYVYNNTKLSPTEDKIIFKEKSKNINLDTKELIAYIDTKYRESYNINKEKISNYHNIIELLDNDCNKISKMIRFKYNYKIDNEIKEIEKHFIIIGNNSIFSNIKII